MLLDAQRGAGDLEGIRDVAASNGVDVDHLERAAQVMPRRGRCLAAH